MNRFALLVIALFIGSLFNSCNKEVQQEPKAVNRAETSEYTTIEGVWEKYDGPNPNYQYQIIYRGKRIPFIYSNGSQFLNKEVRVVVRYINGGPKFNIQSIKIIRNLHPIDSQEAIDLVSALKTDFATIKQDMEDFYQSLEDQKTYVEEMKSKFPFMSAYHKKEETERIEEEQQAAIREISEIEDRIDSVEVTWKAEINSVQWASGSIRKQSLIQDLDNTVEALHSQYDQKLRTLKNYFHNLEIPR